MGTSGRIATQLDVEMLVRKGITIAHPLQAKDPMLIKRGGQVADELGGRLLLHYVIERNIRAYEDGRAEACYVTPTPLSPEETIDYLVVPGANSPREYVYYLDPARIEWIVGPIFVAGGSGIQYILLEGFPAEAIVVPGAPSGRWAVRVS
jgi:hypothetical protein